jgi:DNA polymerase-3 subunit epsilon
LADKPVFARIVDEFLAFIDGAELVIHNAHLTWVSSTQSFK